jgi:hypothetical protein
MASVPDKAHAELGASVADRWMNCPGSVRLSRGQPNYETEHSRAGTAAHHVAQMCLERIVNADTFEGMEFEGIEVTEEMVEAVQVFVDYCRSLRADPDSRSWVEEKFSLASLNPPGPMFGTTDFAAYDPATKTLHVVDLKYGKGVVVEAKGNPQLRYYGLGAVLAVGGGLEIEHVQLTIVQPRAFHPEGVVRHDNIDYLDLLDFADDLMTAAKRTLAPDAPLHAGKHCRFCPAAGFCPEQREMVQALAQVSFEADVPVAPPDPATMSISVLANVLEHLGVVEDWAKQVRLHAQRQLEEGSVSPEALGQKLVAKRANRRWASETQVEKWLVEKGYEPEEFLNQKLKSPKQIETMMGKAKKEIPAEFITKPDTGYTMVPLSDKREGISLAAQDVFPALPPGDA